MKCTTRSLAVQRYGAIDFASKHWPRQSEWIELFSVPIGMFPSWRVLDTAHVVDHIAINKDIHAPLLAALNSVSTKGLASLLHTFDGCFNIRMVRGTNASPSCHAYALAIDLNASLNPLGATHGGFYDHPDFVKCFTDQGFDWGGNFHGRKDPMHYSFAWE